MYKNSKYFNFCCNVLGKDIIKSKFFNYYDKLKLIARCSFEQILLIPDLFENFNYTSFNPVDNSFIYVTTLNYDDFLNKYLKNGYDINKLKIFLLIDENQKYDDKPFLYKYTKNFIYFIYDTTDIKTNIEMNHLDQWYKFHEVDKNNFNWYFNYKYGNFDIYDRNLAISILKNDPFICSDKIFIKNKDDYYFNDLDKVIYLLIERNEKATKQKFYNKEYRKL